MRRLVAVAVFVAAVVLAVGACGIRPDSKPRALAPDDVPYDLLDVAQTTSTTAGPRTPRATVTLWFVRGDSLVNVPRQVEQPVTVGRVLAALRAGPTEVEETGGLRSALGRSVELPSSRPEPDVVTIDISGEVAVLATVEQQLALAQVVFTLTELPTVSAVSFRLNGAPAEVPTPAGSVSGPVGRDAFSGLLPPPPPPPVPEGESPPPPSE